MLIAAINPNSNQAVTDGMVEALKLFLVAGNPKIECITLEEGPFGIESQADVDSVALPLMRMVKQRSDVDAFVIACYSDPGLHVCREATDKPVFGIQECGILTALSQGDRFGVIAIADVSIKRHLRYIRQMGVTERMANERAVNLSVHESATGSQTLPGSAKLVWNYAIWMAQKRSFLAALEWQLTVHHWLNISAYP